MHLSDLLAGAPLLIPSGIPGLYARTEAFEIIAKALERLITELGAADMPETLRFPPLLPQRTLEKNGYFIGFPHLAGCVHSFAGSRVDHKRLLYNLLSDTPIGDELVPTGCALTPAACYPVYPLIAARGKLPPNGVIVDVESYCFRHEPSDDPMRMQSFQMREYVRIGSAERVRAFRDNWLVRAEEAMRALGLKAEISAAHDPFFGAAGASLAAEQEAKNLKSEMLVSVTSSMPPTACMSFNYHETHFTSAWSLHTADDALAHSACVGFGIERLVLALFATHGLDVKAWPLLVRLALWPV